jgi:hypothetical protein
MTQWLGTVGFLYVHVAENVKQCLVGSIKIESGAHNYMYDRSTHSGMGRYNRIVIGYYYIVYISRGV